MVGVADVVGDIVVQHFRYFFVFFRLILKGWFSSKHFKIW